jgi:hypothetical protein
MTRAEVLTEIQRLMVENGTAVKGTSKFYPNLSAKIIGATNKSLSLRLGRLKGQRALSQKAMDDANEICDEVDELLERTRAEAKAKVESWDEDPFAL